MSEECCNNAMRWDEDATGTTCGGLAVRGCWVCAECGARRLGDESHEAEKAWRLTKGGRSIDTGAGRLRVEGGDAERAEALMERLLRLPDLEREVRQLRRELATVRGAGSEP